MKKLLLLSAALLLCSLAHSQEGEGTGRYAEFHLMPRMDFNPYFSSSNTGDASSGITLGNTSVYTLLEGAFSDNVSFTLCNHWAAVPYLTFEDTANLYGSTLYSNANNWLDVLTFDFNFGGWTFSLGKDSILTGGYEFDEWDVDCDMLLIDDKVIHGSYLWYNLPAYQWGAKVSYGVEDQGTLSLQMTTSPFGERPFASGLFCYSGMIQGEHGPFSNMWSASAIQRPDGGFEWLVALANKVEFADDFTFGFDWYNCVDVDYYTDDMPTELVKGSTFRPSLSWAPSEKYDFRLQSNIYTRLKKLHDLNLGLAFHYYPLDFLQVHTLAGWDLNTRSFSVLAGIKADITLFSL